jgi:hypothetical protein
LGRLGRVGLRTIKKKKKAKPVLKARFVSHPYSG